jgi:hypothetical protein
MYVAQTELSFFACRSHTFTHCPRQLVAAVRCPYVIAGAAGSFAQDTARLVANERLGSGLSAIYS